MGLKCGIVGLPNVGKSTLFNALTATMAAESANYPFCTIEPNTGIVSVPDNRLDKLAAIANSAKVIPAHIEFVDIAGLVEGASKGEGLGNKFLSHIREVDAIIHVLRCFDDENITHVNGKVDPIADSEIVEIELMLADLESVTKRLAALEKKIRANDKEAARHKEVLLKVQAALEQAKLARTVIGDDEEGLRAVYDLHLFSMKPILYLCNVLEGEAAEGNEYSSRVAIKAAEVNAQSLVISSKIESEIASLETEEEKVEFLEAIGLEETGLNKIIRSGYKLLNLQSYFTIGPKEARAWMFRVGSTAPEAAGIIHTDFQKGFIRAETISFEDYIAHQGEAGAKENGRMRLEGKDYIVKDGDVIHFRFNV